MTYNELVAVLGKYAQSQYPFEACGIITKDFNFIPSDNLSNKPKSSFIIDPVLLVENDDNIWGIFHSHPDEKYSEPSESDLKMIIYEDLKFILGVNDKIYIYWYDNEKKIKRYERFDEHHCANN